MIKINSIVHLSALLKSKNKKIHISVGFILDQDGGNMEISYWYWDKILSKYVYNNGGHFQFRLDIKNSLSIIMKLVKVPQFKESLQNTFTSVLNQYGYEDLFRIWPNFKLIRNLL